MWCAKVYCVSVDSQTCCIAYLLFLRGFKSELASSYLCELK